MRKFNVNFDEMEWREIIPGLRVKEYQSLQGKLRLAEFSELLVEKEWCKKGHLGLVLEGSATVNFINGEKVVYNKGDFISIPEGESTRHKTQIAANESALIVFFETSV